MVFRFAVVGVVATLVHMSIVWTLVSYDQLEVLPANFIAFLIAFVVSFLGQYRWTFRSARSWHHAMIRFFVVSSLAFALNNIVLVSMLELDLMSDQLTAVTAVLVIPLFTFFLGRLWAFSEP